MTSDRSYQEAKAAWIARQLDGWPPLNEQQKQLIRTAFTAHRAQQKEAAA